MNPKRKIITDTKDMIYIGKDLPDEYSNSKYTAKLKGTLAKAKANIAQGLPELIQNATNKRFKENLDSKHRKNAKYGWYRYDSKVAMPITNDTGDIECYSMFKVEVLVRCDENKKMYLYDIINIKKETSTPLKL